MPRKGQFGPGNSGRPLGARNKLHGDFLQELGKDFAEHGAGVIKIARMEEPVQYLKIVASLLPKEFILSEGNAIQQLSDEEIAQYLALINRKAAEKDEDDTSVRH